MNLQMARTRGTGDGTGVGEGCWGAGDFLAVMFILLQQHKLSVENRGLRVARAKRGGKMPHKKIRIK